MNNCGICLGFGEGLVRVCRCGWVHGECANKRLNEGGSEGLGRLCCGGCGGLLDVGCEYRLSFPPRGRALKYFVLLWWLLLLLALGTAYIIYQSRLNGGSFPPLQILLITLFYLIIFISTVHSTVNLLFLCFIPRYYIL